MISPPTAIPLTHTPVSDELRLLAQFWPKLSKTVYAGDRTPVLARSCTTTASCIRAAAITPPSGMAANSGIL